jgi:catechol 2,3-dioxygenase-like lactoylglutathione lyase family enzyme
MLEHNSALATIPVKDLARAKSFYEGTLGLTPLNAGEPGVAVYRSGSSEVLVYESQYAGTNQATAATWTISGDLTSVVQDLKAKGVTFEHYDLPDTQRQGDVHLAGNSKVAWFKDPDGNILALESH